MNLDYCDELELPLPGGYTSLDNGCLPTITNVTGARPYDYAANVSLNGGRSSLALSRIPPPSEPAWSWLNLAITAWCVRHPLKETACLLVWYDVQKPLLR